MAAGASSSLVKVLIPGNSRPTGVDDGDSGDGSMPGGLQRALGSEFAGVLNAQAKTDDGGLGRLLFPINVVGFFNRCNIRFHIE
jgi:hypothetical protein